MSDAKDNRFYREKPMKSDREFLREIALDIEALHEPRHIYDKIMAHLAAPGVQACDIKAGKPGLILWLNGVFTTDNG